MKNIKCIIFDFDDTIILSEKMRNLTRMVGGMEHWCKVRPSRNLNQWKYCQAYVFFFRSMTMQSIDHNHSIQNHYRTDLWTQLT